MTTITNNLSDTVPNEGLIKEDKKPGFGTFIGVFVPSILMVFGVIIFLRLGWIVGQAGISTAFIIITLATLIAFVTTLSMASISTNIEVGKGGVYYLLSRSLGIEVGSAIGLPLYFKQCLSIAFCVIGFAESLHDLIPAWSITSIGLGTLLTLTLLAYFSLNGALKVQLFIFIALIGSLISLFMGGKELLPTEPVVTGPSQTIGFWMIFAIFFPAMTGIESSVSLSGDLRNPGRSLPLGTISALLVAYAIYMIIPWFLIQNVPRDVLIKDPFIMQSLARVPSLIILGIWGATISSALGGLLGAPRTLQALAEDGVVPKIFGKNFGPAEEPRIATLTTCMIALVGIYFGSVNLIAPLLTMICLICYAVLNFSAGVETLMDNPSWRPRFRIHWTISIFGAALCLMAMMMIDPGYAIGASTLVFFIYTVAKRRQLVNSWDDIRQGILLFFSRFAIYRLALNDFTSKSWRPHFLVFAKNTETSLIHFSQAISRGKGFITVASFVTTPLKNEEEKKELQKTMAKELQAQNVQALVQVSYAEKIYGGMRDMIENYGLGPLTPDTIICGSHANDEIENLATVIQKACHRQCNMIILNSKNDSIDYRISSGDIHVWWDPSHMENGELMLVLAYMLTRNPHWKKAKICLKTIVSCETKRQEAMLKFQKLAETKRLPLHIEVLVAPFPDQEYLNFVSSFSKEASLIFLSLAPPASDNPYQDYAAYLKSMKEFSQRFPATALVMNSANTNLQIF